MARWRSSSSPPRRHDQRLLQAKTTFVRIRCTSCLPSNLAVVGSLPTFIWEEDQGQAGTSGRSVPVSSLVQRRQAAGMESRGSSQRFPFPCNKTKTARTARRRSSPSPPQRHSQRLFAGEDYFCQDKLYYLSPFKSGRCGIPSRQHLGRGPRPL